MLSVEIVKKKEKLNKIRCPGSWYWVGFSPGPVISLRIFHLLLMYLISFSQDPIFLPPSVFLQGYITCEIHFNAVTLIIFITYQHLLCVF